ncbi:MAG: YaiI/YqxD family protein [Nitrospinales bacterium]
MKIWVDADACPKVIKEILYRVAVRAQLSVIFVANQRIWIPESIYITLIHVAQGADIADDEIANNCSAYDLVITADIPLAARIVEKEAIALNPRGTLYDANNIGQLLATRNLLDELRGSDIITGGPSEFSKRDRMNFANELDKFIANR